MSKLIAQLDLGEAIKINQTDSIADFAEYTTLTGLVNLIVPNLFILAGIIFLFLLIYAGLSIIAGDSSKSVEEGKKKLTTAIIGLLVMFSAYWIIQIVGIVVGINILGAPTGTVGPPTSVSPAVKVGP